MSTPHSLFRQRGRRSHEQMRLLVSEEKRPEATSQLFHLTRHATLWCSQSLYRSVHDTIQRTNQIAVVYEPMCETTKQVGKHNPRVRYAISIEVNRAHPTSTRITFYSHPGQVRLFTIHGRNTALLALSCHAMFPRNAVDQPEPLDILCSMVFCSPLACCVVFVVGRWGAETGSNSFSPGDLLCRGVHSW